MDALKLIAQDSLKAEKPAFNVGDTVRVDVKIIEGKNEEISQLIQRGLKIQRWNEELVAENIKLKEQLEKYEDWNRRLQEFMDMDPDSREEVITQYRTSKELNDRFSSILNMYEKMFGMF